MSTDPLKDALAEITSDLDPDRKALVDSLLADQPLEDSWQALIQEVLDEA